MTARGRFQSNKNNFLTENMSKIDYWWLSNKIRSHKPKFLKWRMISKPLMVVWRVCVNWTSDRMISQNLPTLIPQHSKRNSYTLFSDTHTIQVAGYISVYRRKKSSTFFKIFFLNFVDYIKEKSSIKYQFIFNNSL